MLYAIIFGVMAILFERTNAC